MKGPTLYDSMLDEKRTIEKDNRRIKMFTCGPSIYARPHIGNYRTFLFQDLLVRYLEYSGFHVERAMNLTDVEDKAIWMAQRRGLTVDELTRSNEERLWHEWDHLGMKRPTHVPRSSGSIKLSVELIKLLLKNGIAYWHEGDVFYDPLKFPGFGRLFGLDMSRWPEKKRRFKKDTYPGVQWNLGDFILWHGCGDEEKVCWDDELGSGRPSWNVQDAAMCWETLGTEIDIWMGGWDNLWRHHDYNIAVMEGAHGGTLARYWYHTGHMLLDGKKMSKSKGNVLYPEDLEKMGFLPGQIRFYLLYGYWRSRSNLTMADMKEKVNGLNRVRDSLAVLFGSHGEGDDPHVAHHLDSMEEEFEDYMNNDMNVKEAFDSIFHRVERLLHHMEKGKVSSDEARRLKGVIESIDSVLGFLTAD